MANMAATPWHNAAAAYHSVVSIQSKQASLACLEPCRNNGGAQILANCSAANITMCSTALVAHARTGMHANSSPALHKFSAGAFLSRYQARACKQLMTRALTACCSSCRLPPHSYSMACCAPTASTAWIAPMWPNLRMGMQLWAGRYMPWAWLTHHSWICERLSLSI